MRILSFETSCDETSCAVLEKKNQEIVVLSNVTASSLSLHAKTGGIIPENAAREQIKTIIPVMEEALLRSENIEAKNGEQTLIANKILKEKIDAIAVTHGPGLIGSLLVGVETAKTLSFVFNKPIVPVNHLLAHIFANFISSNSRRSEINFPFVGLIVSGGHTDLLFFESIEKYKWLGGTRDDAAGEALDKIGRLLDLPYPAGPEIEQRATKVKKPSIVFKSPLINSQDLDFSFSGLKTEVLRFVQNKVLDEQTKNEVCYAVQKAIIDVLVKKTVRAAKMFEVNQILLGGGVSANQTLLENFKEKTDLEVFSPEKPYTTDNAGMIGAYALMNFKTVNWKIIDANPDLYFV